MITCCGTNTTRLFIFNRSKRLLRFIPQNDASFYDITSHNGKPLGDIDRHLFECLTKIFRERRALCTVQTMKSPECTRLLIHLHANVICCLLPRDSPRFRVFIRIIKSPCADSEMKTKKRVTSSNLGKSAPSSVAFRLTFHACDTCRGILMATGVTKVWKVCINVA